MLLEGEIVVDNFAGGGGASEGMSLGLDRHVDIAINHDPAAIDMHKVNHPETKHFCESVWDVDPVAACAGRSVGVAWFSPDCKHFSRAKGSTPVDKNIRGLAWVAVRWAALVPLRNFYLENVEEFLSWGPVIEVGPGKYRPCQNSKGETFDAFIKVLTTGLSSDHPAWPEIVEILGDDFPFYDRLKTGLGYQVEYQVLSACDFGAPTTRKRFFLIARNDGVAIHWPEKTHGPIGSGLKSYRTVADIIDWSVPVRSIFNRKKPLAENTMRRIAKGVEKFVMGSASPFIVRIGQTGFGGDRLSWSIDRPLTTVTSKAEHLLIKPHLSRQCDFDDKPMIADEVRAFIIKYYGPNIGLSCDEPLHTITTKDRFGLVTIQGEDYAITDISMRMLEPHELFAAQGFPSDYKISHDSKGKKLSKASQVARCGNAVCPPVARALVEANMKSNQVAVAA